MPLGDTESQIEPFKSTLIRADEVLSETIAKLNGQKLSDQRPTPDPVLIDDPTGETDQLIVFTSYMRQAYASNELVPDGLRNWTIPDEETSYPTVYFYSLAEKKIVWEIHGADAFVHIKKTGSAPQVYFLANQKWSLKTDYRAGKDAWAIQNIDWKFKLEKNDRNELLHGMRRLMSFSM